MSAFVNFGDSRADERFWARVSPCPMSGCWLWTGSENTKGYGKIIVNGRTSNAHRIAYCRLVGPVPAELDVDHKCRVRCCVNPAHLEPVTHRENMMRGVGFASINARRIACHRGHRFTDENTRVRVRADGSTHRECRQCTRDNDQANQSKRRNPLARLRWAWRHASKSDRSAFIAEISEEEH